MPEQINTADAEGSFLGRLEHKTGNDKPDLTGGFTYGLPRLSDDVGAYFEGNVTYKGMQEWNGDLSAMFTYQNQFYLGSKITGCLKTRKASEITGIAAANIDGNFIYMHTNCLKNILRFGFSTKNVEHFGTLAAETEIALKEKGTLQDRTTTKVAFDHAITEDSTLKVKFDISKKVLLHTAFIHNINKNLKVTFSDTMNPIGFFTEPAKEKYSVGVALEGNF